MNNEKQEVTSTFLQNCRLTIFGRSHGPRIGAVLEGFPAGVPYEEDFVLKMMARRAPGGAFSTKRKEPDLPVVTSGISDGKTDGSPIEMYIENTNQHSDDYGELILPRPSHADYPAYVKYGGKADLRGGGHFSGRLTAPMVFAGALAMLYLREKGVRIASHLLGVGFAEDRSFSELDGLDEELFDRLFASPFPVLDENAGEYMKQEISMASLQGDSVGALIECAATGLPVGLGEHMARGVEGTLSSLLFSIPAVKGVQFGEGFGFVKLRGSQANDGYAYNEKGEVTLLSNHCGGIAGGMSTGAPLLLQVAFKPTPSIFLPQKTVNLKTGRNEILQIKGRHDPCIGLRALPVVESAVALGLLDLFLDEKV
jgi:chorismate synthase